MFIMTVKTQILSFKPEENIGFLYILLSPQCLYNFNEKFVACECVKSHIHVHVLYFVCLFLEMLWAKKCRNVVT